MEYPIFQTTSKIILLNVLGSDSNILTNCFHAQTLLFADNIALMESVLPEVFYFSIVI